jgi:zinc protease
MKKTASIVVRALSALCVLSMPMAAPGQPVPPDSPIPLDSSVTSGSLGNGLRFFIKANRRPEKRAELRLVVNAGSVLEDDDQAGLAHFTEHMAFNGTAHFKKQELVRYMESIGMAFGPEVNAYTNYDETVYKLTVPTDAAGALDKAVLILQDWAKGILFEDDAISAERGVVIEEWRLGRGADARIQDRQFPVLFAGSRYAERLPIGRREVLETFKPATLRKYYSDWYRPDLMAVIAVGDFDGKAVESLIRFRFKDIAAPRNPRPRTVFEVPDHGGTRYAVISDPEASGSEIGVYFKSGLLPEKTVSDYGRILAENVYDAMMNQRLFEQTRRPDPPFVYALSGKGRMVRSKGVYYLGAGVKDNGILPGLEALLTEAERVRRFGFRPSELERTKTDMVRSLERAAAEAGKTESAQLASELVRHFLSGEPDPGPAWELEMTKAMLPGIGLDALNRLPAEWMPDANRAVLIGLPEKAGVRKPSEAELASVFSRVRSKAIEPYRDDVLDRPLVQVRPAAGRVVSSSVNQALGTTEWTLSNGVRAVLKPTDFKNDEIRFMAYSPGGNSLAGDANAVAAATAAPIMRECGAGEFTGIQLDKRLTGKAVRVSPSIGMLTEGISGSASPGDAESMFELIYLTMTSPRRDTSAFRSYRERMKGMLENRSKQPESSFYDTLQVTLASHHRRARPWSLSILDEMNLDSSLAFYRDRFSDAGDFTFFIAGNFSPDSVRPLVETWLGGLPSSGRRESWKDLGIRPPRGVVEKVVRRGIESKSRVALVFTGPWNWSPENNHRFESMAGFLRIRLREVLREDLGGTYGVSVTPTVTLFPDAEYSLSITFGCSPDRVEELTRSVFNQIDQLKKSGPGQGDLAKVKEIQRRDYETDMKQNGFWLDALWSASFTGQSAEQILRTPERIDRLSVEDVRKTAGDVLRPDNYVRVILLPETPPAP